MARAPKLLTPRKLLVAALGVATLNAITGCDKPPTSGNLPAPQPTPHVDGGATPPSTPTADGGK